MTRARWRDVFKFASGAAFAATAANLFLALSGVTVPVFGFTITPRLFALRALGTFVLFVVLFYFGYLKKNGGP